MGSLITETPLSEFVATMEVLDRWGVGREDLKKFRKASSYVQMEVVRLMQRGDPSKPRSAELLVDYSIRPSLVEFVIDEHPNRVDKVVLDISDIELVMPLLPNEGRISGWENLRRLSAKVVSGEIKTLLDVRVAEELLKRPELIPNSWKDRTVFFWGTIFRTSVGDRVVIPYLCRVSGRWGLHCYWLGGEWSFSSPAAVLAA